MRILFSMRHSGALRNFASTIEELARRGHQIHLTFMMQDKLRDDRLLEELTGAFRAITHAFGAASPQPWLGLARTLRSAANYARYRTPDYVAATALHDRAASRVSPAVRKVTQLPLVRTRTGLRLATRLLHALERVIPPDPAIVDLMAQAAPDLVLVTPLVDLTSDQVEYVKAARALGLPCGLCVHSWDNLTNKGLIHVLPDRVFVWNDTQRREAVELHGVPDARVVVTGAPTYDQWFERSPSTSRDAFCRKVGLPSERPYFLYLCSSLFIAPHEADFVKRWIQAVRSAPDPNVRAAGVLVRPHPHSDMRPWKGLDLAQFRDVVLWPSEATNPVDSGSKNDYFDSIYHSAAAVGINTSAQIEAGIVGRRVYSIRAPEYAATQEGTLHFHYLLSEHGGLLDMAPTLDDHARALAETLNPSADDQRRLREFVAGFVRPNGLDVAATPLLADAIEQLGRIVSAPERAPLWARLLRPVLYRVALRMKMERPAERPRALAAVPPGGPIRKKGEWVH